MPTNPVAPIEPVTVEPAAPAVHIPPAGGWKALDAEGLAALIATIQANIKHEVEFFHDPDKTPWARVLIGGQNGHYEHMPVYGPEFKLLVTKRLRDDMGGMPRPVWVNGTIQECAGTALFGEGDIPAQTHKLHLRTAAHEDAVYLDLGDDQWRIVKITATGWFVVSDAPVRFRRPVGMHSLPTPLPLPVPTDVLDTETKPEVRKMLKTTQGLLKYLFHRFVNVQEQDQILVLSWLIAAFRPDGPYPILAFHGQQGSAKSSSQTLLKRLIDPSTAPMRTAPRDEHDLMISAKQSYVLGFDNFSKIDPWLSDALCRLVTGGGFATRKLRTDDTQVIFDATRAIMLNGIDDVAERGDLMERMLVIRCPSFSAGKRRPEAYLEYRFQQIYPYLLGALCSVFSKTMAKYAAKVEHKNTRMADFASWATAAEEALGYKPDDFMKAYGTNQQELRYLALEFSPTITALIDWKRGRKNVRYSGHKADWTGTHQELLVALIGPGRNFINVRTSKGLAVEITRAEPALRSIGIVVEHLPREAGTGRRLIRIKDVG